MFGAMTPRFGHLDFKYRFLVGFAIFIGLFFVEYPPIFVLGYWGWGALVHKTISGALLILNLVLAQYLAKRLGLFGSPSNIGTRKTVPPAMKD